MDVPDVPKHLRCIRQTWGVVTKEPGPIREALLGRPQSHAPRWLSEIAGHTERVYFSTVSLTEIKSAVRELSPKELAELTAFISEQDNAVWREQMEQDAASGKLDFLFQEADEERRAGKLRDWPENE